MATGFVLALLGLVSMIILTGIASAIGTVIAGSATLGAIKKAPDIFGKAMAIAAMPATHGLYGFVTFILYKGKVGELSTTISVIQGTIVLSAGLIVGLVGLVAAIKQAQVCAHGITSMGNGEDVFAKTMILAAFPELYSILAFAASILMLDLVK